MGSGIAQVAAQAGWDVLLRDVDPALVRRQIDKIAQQLEKLVERGKLAPDARAAALARIRVADSPAALGPCELVIEAIIEDLEIKAQALAPLAAIVGPPAIFATNTSSLSVSTLARRAAEVAGTPIAPRVVGMHFFNPVPLLPLVEIIAGERTRADVVARAAQIATSWGKTVVHAKDTPGFIVNRVARGYYLEALRMLGEGVAGIDEIDRSFKHLSGFRMGPFELMDLIGIDVNYNVTLSVWEQLGRPPRLAPHPIQRQLFDAGHFGRKTQRGFYSYASEPPLPAVVVPRQSFELPAKLYQAVRRCADAATQTPGSITEQYVFTRILATIINEAALLHDEGAASIEDIDTAMKLGTNYPKGPLEWAVQIGRRTVAGLLRALNETFTDDRFAPAAWLRT
jgi:3-hydroxybutyryl-CoA dehydrogenase